MSRWRDACSSLSRSWRICRSVRRIWPVRDRRFRRSSSVRLARLNERRASSLMKNFGARVFTTADNHDKRLHRNSLHLSSLLRPLRLHLLRQARPNHAQWRDQRLFELCDRQCLTMVRNACAVNSVSNAQSHGWNPDRSPDPCLPDRNQDQKLHDRNQLHDPSLRDLSLHDRNQHRVLNHRGLSLQDRNRHRVLNRRVQSRVLSRHVVVIRRSRRDLRDRIIDEVMTKVRFSTERVYGPVHRCWHPCPPRG